MYSYGTFFLIFLQLLEHHFIATARNNACKNFEDYFHSDTSQNCFYNPDMFLETPALIEKYAGKVESHKVTTDDGYILTMFRIPRTKPKGTILLQHPLASNSRLWVAQGNESLAFYLWHAGYDIWLSNARGTLFSEGHKKLKISSFQYWDFSFHEIGIYDISSQIKLIRSKINNSKISFIGHSMGTTTGLIYSSMHSLEAKNSINAFALLAIPVYFKYATSAIKYFVPYERILKENILDSLKLGNVIPFLPILQISRIIFRIFPAFLLLVNVVISATSGWTPEEVDPAFLNYDIVIYIKNLSWKTLIHFLQLFKSETRFQMFDYGEKQNLKLYNSKTPAHYPVENISVPVFIISSANDTLTTLQDSDLLYEKLSNEAKVYEPLKVSGLNHVDYFGGIHKKEIFYGKLLNFLNNISKSGY